MADEQAVAVSVSFSFSLVSLSVSKLFRICLTEGKVEQYWYTVAVWIDWTAIALVSTKSWTGLIKIAVAPCVSECLASFSRHSAVSPALLPETEAATIRSVALEDRAADVVRFLEIPRY